MTTCQYKIGTTKNAVPCGEDAHLQDPHGRWLCDTHYDIWKAKHKAGQEKAVEVVGRVLSVEIDPLEKLLYMLETNTGDALDIAECVQECRTLVSKLRGKL